MAVRIQQIFYSIAPANRPAGNAAMFLCDLESELPTTDVFDGDEAYAKNTGNPFTRTGGAWVLNTAIDVVAVRLLETGAPTSLLIGSVTDGQFLKRVGTNLVGAAVSGSEAFPVGSVFVSVVSTNPATLLGYGTWAVLGTGRTLVGLDVGDPDFDTLEKLSGSKNITLTEAQIPAHTHLQNSHGHTQDAHSHTQRRNNVATGANSGWVTAFDASSSSPVADVNTGTGATTATNQATTAVNQNTGGGGSHSNVQPSFVVLFWKRTA